MRLLLVPALSIVTTSCTPCGRKLFGGGEATITLTVLEPEVVETTWVVPGMTKEQLSRGPADDYTEMLAAGFEGASIAWPRGPDADGGMTYLEIWVPTEDNPGIGCIEEPLVGFVLWASWFPEDDVVGDLQMNFQTSESAWEDSSIAIGSAHNESLDIETDGKTEGSLDASDMHWQRIEADWSWVDCAVSATLSASWQLERFPHDVQGETCEWVSLF